MDFENNYTINDKGKGRPCVKFISAFQVLLFTCNITTTSWYFRIQNVTITIKKT